MFKSTHAQGDLVQVEEGATRFLGLEGLTVGQVVIDDARGRIVHAVTADEVAAGCPECGVVSTSRKGRVVTFPRDVPYGQDLVRLVWHKHRWRCQERLCPRGSFTESIGQVPARARLTCRLRGEVGAAAADRFSCLLGAAAHYRVSWPIAHAALAGHIAGPLAEPLPILHAYTVKEDLRALLALAGTNPTRAEIAHQLERFYRRAASCPAPEAHRLAETIEAWWPAIEAAITTGYSNARSEGYNRLAKHVGRNAFGFRNVDNQRQRIRWACTPTPAGLSQEHPVARSSLKCRERSTLRRSGGLGKGG